MTRAFFIHTIPSRSLLSQSFLSVKTLGLVKHGKRVREEIEGGVKEDYWWGRKVIHLGNSSICPFLFTIHCHWCSTSILPSFHSLNHLSTSKPINHQQWIGKGHLLSLCTHLRSSALTYLSPLPSTAVRWDERQREGIVHEEERRGRNAR